MSQHVDFGTALSALFEVQKKVFTEVTWIDHVDRKKLLEKMRDILRSVEGFTFDELPHEEISEEDLPF